MERKTMSELTNQTKVSIVAGICLLALTIILKNVLLISGDVLSRDILLYIIIYWAFSLVYPAKDERVKKSRWDNPLYWSAVIILITVAIILVYAL
jgi:hypothetical protein